MILFSDDGVKWPDDFAVNFPGTPAGQSPQIELVLHRRYARIHTPAEGDRPAQVFNATLTPGFRYAIVLEEKTARLVLRSHSANPSHPDR